MAVRIRLRRIGAKKKPFYRVVVADSRSPRDGRFLDTIGWYDPLADPARIEIDEEKALRWLNDGAEPSDSARSVLSMAGVLGRRAGGDVPAPAPAAAPKAAAQAPAAAAVPPAAPSPAAAPPAAEEPAAPAPPAPEEPAAPAPPAPEEPAAPATERGEA